MKRMRSALRCLEEDHTYPSNMFQSIGDILQLLVDQNWESFSYNVLSSRDVFRHLSSAIASCSQLNGMTLLHAIVMYDPPLEIVARMIEFCPEMPAAEDCLRRTPLHVAAGSRASVSLIELLAHAHPAACDAQDEERKTSLHFACDSSCVLFEDDFESGITPRQPPNHEAVAVLLSYSVHAVTLEDDEDMTPLEHAIQSDASLETVKLLQDETRQATKVLSTYQIRPPQLNEGIQSFISATKSMRIPAYDGEYMSSLGSKPTKKVKRVSGVEGIG